MSNVDRTRTHAAVIAASAVAAEEQQPEGWRFVPDTILPGQWVPARTPTVHWGPISGKAVGGPNTVQHSSNSAETLQTWLRSNVDPGQERWQQEHCWRESIVLWRATETEEPIELMHEDFQVHVDSDWVGDLLERKNTTGVIVRRGIEERVSTTSENNVYNIYVKPMSISTCFINTEMLMIVARTHVDYVGCTLMVFHSSAMVVENDGTRKMGSRVQCNEFGDETNPRLVESGTSAKLVGTSVRLVGDDFCVVARQKQIQTRCELSVWEILVCECDDRLVIKQFRIHWGKERCPGMNSSIQMRDEMCLMNVRRKSRIWPDNRGMLFNCRFECRGHSGTMPCETRNVSWRMHTMLCKTSRFRGRRTWCWTCRGDDACQWWTCCDEEGELVTHAASEGSWRMQQITPRRRCVFLFVSPDQAGEKLMMRCHQYCGGATDSVHRQSSGYPGCAREKVVPILWGVCVCVCVPEACDVRIVIAAILKMKLVLMFGIHGWVQMMNSEDERLYTANSRAWGRPRTWMFKCECRT